MSVKQTEVQQELPSAALTRRWALTWETAVVAGLVAILLLGAYFRFTGLNWDGDHHLHPDERFLTDIAGSLQAEYNPLVYLRSSVSRLNPYNLSRINFYVYGNFPMTATRFVAEWVGGLCDNFGPPGQPGSLCPYNFTVYNGIHLVGRFLSGLMDLISIWLTFLIGRRLYNGRAALLAAFMLATAVIPIQQSHFFTMDNWAAALSTATLYAAVRAAGLGDDAATFRATRFRRRWWVLFGIFLGLAVASRINVAPLALLVVVAAVVWLARSQPLAPGQSWRTLLSRHYPHLQLMILLAAVVSAVTVRLAQPYAFNDGYRTLVALGLRPADADPALAETLPPVGVGDVLVATGSLVFEKIAEADRSGKSLPAIRGLAGTAVALVFNERWLANMAEIQRLQSPDALFPPALQWTDRLPIIFPLTNMLLYGMGPLAGLVAWTGFLWALWRICRGRPDWSSHALPVAWVGLYFLFIATRWVTSIRYFLPIYPLLFVLGGWALWRLGARAADGRSWRNGRSWPPALAGLLIGAVGLTSLLWANAFVQIYRQPVTRIAASAWIYDNVQSGATLLYTVDGRPHEKVLPLREFEFAPVTDGEGYTLPLNLDFDLPVSAVITGLRFNYLSAPDDGPVSRELDVRLVDIGRNQTLAAATPAVTLGAERQAVTVSLPETAVSPAAYALVVTAGPGGRIQAGTSTLINEHWDDPLPVRLDGRDGFFNYYNGVAEGTIPITNLDDETKRESFYRWLDEGDYIMLSSQRALWSVPRLPLSYPMTIRYYDALFSGELGFELVHQEHAYLRIGPLYISDTAGRIGWGRPPEVGWPPPGRLAAEEAFSVYDHPPVWIFAKTERYRPELVRAALEPVDLSLVVRQTPGEASQAPNALMLSPQAAAVQQANGTYREMFDLDGLLARYPGLTAVIWWLAVVALGWLTFPLSFVIFRGLPDRGFALSRILALLLVSYFAWLLASLQWLPHSRGTLALGLLLLLLVNGYLFRRRRVEITAWVRDNRALIGLVELLGVALFLLQIGIRLGNPDVWDVIWGGEKPMDLAYFNAVLKSTTFPPYDPWFAGGYINYYYYGFVYVGALTKLLGVAPAIAYNLILPMLFSFTGLGAFSLAYNLVAYARPGSAGWGPGAAPANEPRRTRLGRLRTPAVLAGLMAMSLAVLLGNLAQFGVIVDAWQKTSDSQVNTGITAVDSLVRTVDGGLDMLLEGKPAAIYTGNWFWNATRTINAAPGEPGPITEFPFFTFLYGDLHAHMINLPLTILALGWAMALALRGRVEDKAEGDDGNGRSHRPENGFETAARWLIGGVAIGVLQATNTWDWPTYLVLGALAVIYHAYQLNGGWRWATIGQAGYQAAALAVLSALTFLPYTANFGTAFNSLRLWDGSYTYVSAYLRVHGLFLFLAGSYLCLEFRAWTRGWTTARLAAWRRWMAPVLAAAVLYPLLLLFLFARGYWVAPIALTLIIAAGLLGLRPGLPDQRRVALILLSSALGLTLFVEIVVLSGDVGRMNTVFKFYIQSWMLLSIVAGAGLAWTWPNVSRWRPPARRIWQTTFGLLLFVAALYPLLATPAKWRIRMSQAAPTTLDGMAFLQTTSYSDHGREIDLIHDYEALRWMQANVDGSPVIAEAHSPAEGYSPYRSVANRVAMYTGLPAVIGWDWHQRGQQRSALPPQVVQNRVTDVNRLYNTTDPAIALELLDRYGIRYVYVGQLEWAYYQPEGLVKFDQMAADGLLREVYRNGGTSIFMVERG